MNRLVAASVRLTLMGVGAAVLLMVVIAAGIGTLEFPMTGIAPWDGALAYLSEAFGSVNVGASIISSVGFGSLVFLPLAAAGFLNGSFCQVHGVSSARLLAKARRFAAALFPTAGPCRTAATGSARSPLVAPNRKAAYTSAHLSGAAPQLE